MCGKLYIFWIHVVIWLIWAYFHQNRTILKIWPLYKRSMIFSYFVLYLENGASYGYRVIDFFTPYNERNNMTCITTKLKHSEFSSAWGGSQYPQGGLCVLFLWYPWNCRVGTPWGIFLHRGDQNNRWSHAMSCLLPGYNSVGLMKTYKCKLYNLWSARKSSEYTSDFLS